MLATVVDIDSLWQTVVAALLAGVGTTIVFSIAILGVARLSEANREGRGFQAAAFGGLAIVGLLATVAAIVFGVIVMTTK